MRSVVLFCYTYIYLIYRSSISYVGGGCALNSVRVFQWLSGVDNRSMFLGGLGRDDNGDVLDNLVKKDGVLTAFAIRGLCVQILVQRQNSPILWA